jgi:DNA modification methylase
VTATRKPVLYEDGTQSWGLIEADALLLLAKLPDSCVDAIVTDPPYGIGFGGDWDGKAITEAVSSKGERLSAREAFLRWTRVWAIEARRVLKPGGHAVFLDRRACFTCSQPALKTRAWKYVTC